MLELKHLQMLEQDKFPVMDIHKLLELIHQEHNTIFSRVILISNNVCLMDLEITQADYQFLYNG